MRINMVHEADDHDILVEMNTTPLIDVMLVLLVMLIITIPVQTHAVKLILPVSPPHNQPAPVVRIHVNADGLVLWNDEIVGDMQALESRLRHVVAMSDPPEVHLRAHRLARYEYVARVMALVQRVGIIKFGIVGQEQFAQSNK